MGGPERLARQAAKGRLNARERVARLCDEGTFREVGALGAGAHPAGGEPVPADALVGGVARVAGRPVGNIGSGVVSGPAPCVTVLRGGTPS